MVRILSLDGGGCKGIIPATILAEIEQQTGKLIRESFSFVGGTSTGALITAAIAAGVPAQKMVDLYLNRADEIFKGGPLKTLRRLTTGAMYDPNNIKTVLESLIGSAKDWTVNDCPIDILITSKRLTDGKPWYFVKDQPGQPAATGFFKLVDAAVASASAPTYFKPWHIPSLGYMVDGGVGVAGNPVYQTAIEAFEYTPKYKPEETSILSLGTGWSTYQGTPKGLIGWLEWTIHELLDSPTEEQTEIVQRMYPKTPLQRIDFELPSGTSMDDPKQVPMLYELAKKQVAALGSALRI